MHSSAICRCSFSSDDGVIVCQLATDLARKIDSIHASNLLVTFNDRNANNATASLTECASVFSQQIMSHLHFWGTVARHYMARSSHSVKSLLSPVTSRLVTAARSLAHCLVICLDDDESLCLTDECRQVYISLNSVLITSSLPQLDMFLSWLSLLLPTLSHLYYRLAVRRKLLLQKVKNLKGDKIKAIQSCPTVSTMPLAPEPFQTQDAKVLAPSHGDGIVTAACNAPANSASSLSWRSATHVKAADANLVPELTSNYRRLTVDVNFAKLVIDAQIGQQCKEDEIQRSLNT